MSEPVEVLWRCLECGLNGSIKLDPETLAIGMCCAADADHKTVVTTCKKPSIILSFAPIVQP